MSDQAVTLNDMQRMICEANHFKIDPPDEDGFYTLTVRDPVLRAKKVKLPKHRGRDLSELIAEAKAAQDVRNGADASENAPDASETVETVENVSETVETEDTSDASESVADEDATEETEDEPPVSNVVSLRRVVITEQDTAPPSVLKDVILDDTGKKTRKTPSVKVSTRKHRDNRLARAFRAILENPEMTVAEQADVAHVTPAMLGYYEIQLRSCFKIIYEKFGEDCIPMLPKLNK